MAILFRLFPKYGVNNLNAIIVNYFTCFTVGSLISRQFLITSDLVSHTWFPYALFLSLTFILFFNVNAFTIQKVGMIITSVFQKLSLVGPVVMGLLVFGESGNLFKYIAIALTVLAILFINYSPKTDSDLSTVKQYWYWPLLVFFGSGLIECTLFFAQETGVVSDSGLAFTSVLFLMAGCWGLLFKLITKRWKLSQRDVIAGLCIGVPNFFTIWLIMKGLEVGWEGSVLFPLNNVGVIFFTAIIGIAVFKEKLNKINLLGLLLASVAVILISQ